jgi:hypothetical protein
MIALGKRVKRRCDCEELGAKEKEFSSRIFWVLSGEANYGLRGWKMVAQE